MSLLVNLLYPPANYRRSVLSTIAWWESKRVRYNVAVGATGFFTLGIVKLIALLPPGVPARFGWQPIVAYALLANVAYSFGAPLEIGLKRFMKDERMLVGPALFRQGLAFSVGLTLLPIAVVSIGWVVRVGAWLIR